ncbi:hypothetical protein Bca101_006031 [Brassica carinata]
MRDEIQPCCFFSHGSDVYLANENGNSNNGSSDRDLETMLQVSSEGNHVVLAHNSRIIMDTDIDPIA